MTRPINLPPLAPRKPIDEALNFGESPEPTLVLPAVDRRDVLAIGGVAATAVGLIGLLVLMNW